MYMLNNFNILYKNLDIIKNELFDYLNNSSNKLRLYLFTDNNLNKKYFNSRILKLRKEFFFDWYNNKTLNACKAISVFFSLNATHSIRPNHFMRIYKGTIYYWEDCLDFSKYLTLTNKLTFDNKRYCFTCVFLKPNQILCSSGSDMKPYNYSKYFLLSDSLKLNFKNKEFYLDKNNRHFTFYTQSPIKIINNTDKMQYFLSSSYFMFDYDIKNNQYEKQDLKFQPPRL